MGTESYFRKLNISKGLLQKCKTSLLFGLTIELTERCNSNCIHCYINLPSHDLNAKKKELSADRIKDILREAVSLGCMAVRFTGGEPLLRGDFQELYIFARKLGLRVLLFTNAILITPGIAKLFVQVPLLDKIEVSVYGMKKSSYEAVTRVTGSYDAAWKGMSLLVENKIPFIVKTALLPSNKSEISEFEAWAGGIPWMKKPVTYSMFLDLRGRRDDAEKNKLISKIRLTPEEALKVFAGKRQLYIKEMKDFCSRFIGPAGNKLFSCGSGLGGGCVDAYGCFQPCMLLRHPAMVYNLDKGSLEDALKNFFPKVREMEAVNLEYLNRCAKCFLKGFCEQCPAKSWMEHGTLDTPVEYLCRIAHSQARFLGLLGRDELAWEVTNWKRRIKEFIGKDVD